MTYYHTSVPKAKIAVTLEADLVSRLDTLVRQERFRNRSQALEAALEEQLQRLHRSRLAEECARLDPDEEQALAEDELTGNQGRWPAS
jgi:Arc/MetJ-type ribon-helix-helix transcriptional regulator